MCFRTAHCICVLLLLPAAALHAFYEKAHQEVARVGLEILKKNDPSGIYAEVYAEKNSRRILDGSWQEDFGAVGGHDRAFRHYWDPDANRGCPWFVYYWAMIISDELSAMTSCAQGAPVGDVKRQVKQFEYISIFPLDRFVIFG